MAKEKGRKLVAQNRKARHDYHIGDTYEAGIVLSGTEVKSLREGRANLADAFATVDDGEVLAAVGAHPGVQPRHLDQPHRAAQPQAAAQSQGDHPDRARPGDVRHDPGAAGALLLRRVRQGRDRARHRQAGLRQAAEHRRTGVQARGRARTGRPEPGRSDVRLIPGAAARPALRLGRHPRHHHPGVRGRRPDRRVRDHLRGAAQRGASGDREDRLAVRRQLRPARHPALHRHPRAVRRRRGRGLPDHPHRHRPARTPMSPPNGSAPPTSAQDGREEHTRLRIGDPDRTISADTATYVISYDLAGAHAQLLRLRRVLLGRQRLREPVDQAADRSRRRCPAAPRTSPASPARPAARTPARPQISPRAVRPSSPRATSRPVRASRSASRSRQG